MPVRVRKLPSAEYLKECFDYNPATGELTWRERPRSHFVSDAAWRTINARCAGKPAGTPTKNGYYALQLDGQKNLRRARIIWKMMTGNDPVEVDHRDTNPSNDRWSNLREADRQGNTRNTHVRKTNKTGFKGVYRHKNRFRAVIRVNGRGVHLGLFDTPELAHAAYEEAARVHHGDFARSN